MPAFPPPVLHPVLVHGPLLLIPLAALLASLSGSRPWALQATRLVTVLAALASVAALATGLDAGDDAEGRIPAATASLLDAHEFLGWTVLVMSLTAAAAVLWRKGGWMAGRGGAYLAAYLWAATLAVALAGWYGGALVYEHGVGVPHA